MAEVNAGGSVQVCGMRTATLGPDGVPLPGPANLYVTNSIAKLVATPAFVKGVDMESVNGCGAPLILYKDQDRFKRYDLTLELVYLDYELEQMLVNGELYTLGGFNIGHSSPATADYAGTPNGVSFEAWSKHIVNGDIDPLYPYIQWVIPRSYWANDASTFDNNPMPRLFTGYTSTNTNYYNGPANDWPYSSDRQMMSRLTTTLPTPVLGAQTLVHS